MTLRKAVAKAKVSLGKRYGRSWKQGKKKRVSCVEQTSTFTCRATWMFKGKKKRGFVSIAKP